MLSPVPEFALGLDPREFMQDPGVYRCTCFGLYFNGDVVWHIKQDEDSPYTNRQFIIAPFAGWETDNCEADVTVPG